MTTDPPSGAPLGTARPTGRPWRARMSGDEWIGLAVLLAVVIFLGAVLQAGVLRDWLTPSATLRVLLPDSGIGGLSVGAEVEVLGTRAGTVRRVVIAQASRLYAEVQLDEQAKAFVRRDSVATIRRRYGVAGAAFLDIARGTGAPLDWNLAVIEAATDRAPTETIGAIFDELRGKVLPILDDLGQAARSLSQAAGRLERGEGPVARLLSDEEMGGQMRDVVAQVRGMVDTLGRTLGSVETAAADGARLTGSLSGPQGVPALLRRADAMMADLQRVTRELARIAPRGQPIVRSAEESIADVPALLLQAQSTARELEQLTAQLRGLWFLGGGGTPAAPERQRVPVERIRP